jgi:hypothetical protein
MLEELQMIQQSGKPLVLDLTYYKTHPDGSVEEICHPNVHFYFLIQTVNGDSEGQDKQVGKISVRGKNSNCNQWRICDCSSIFLDDPNVKSKQILGPRITKLVEIANDDSLRKDQRDRAEDRLKEANYRPKRLGWSDMLFCDPVHGINGAVPPDILHMIRHGLIQYLLRSLFGLKHLKKRKKKRTIIQPTDADEDSEADSDEDIEDNDEENIDDDDSDDDSVASHSDSDSSDDELVDEEPAKGGGLLTMRLLTMDLLPLTPPYYRILVCLPKVLTEQLTSTLFDWAGIYNYRVAKTLRELISLVV